MSYITLSYDEFINESHPATAWSASLYNTPGMGNVTSSGTLGTFSDAFHTGDQDGYVKFHPDLVIEDDGTDSWMRPSGDYGKRGWLMPNYTQYMKMSQSNARFQVGDFAVCIDPNMGCHGKVGKIIAFEDNTIRFEILNTETGVGQTAKQYRCLASCLRKI